MDTLTTLLTRLGIECRDDPSAPSVQLSRLHNGEYYASIRRYAAIFGQDSYVVTKAKDLSMDSVLFQLAANWDEYVRITHTLSGATANVTE